MTPLEHADLAEAIAGLARSWTAPEDHDATLQRITESAVAAIPGADSADIMTTEPGGKVHSQAPTSHFPTRIDRLQETCGQGPCLDAATDKVLVRADDLQPKPGGRNSPPPPSTPASPPSSRSSSTPTAPAPAL